MLQYMRNEPSVGICQESEGIVRAQFLLFKFQLLTSQDSHTHSLSHGNLITPLTPIILLSPYDLHIKTNMDKNKEHSRLDVSIPELSEDNDNN